MGMDLQGPGGSFSWNIFQWGKLLDLAERYGWTPAGTLAPDPDPVFDDPGSPPAPWDGGYFWNDFQRVADADAANLAAAIERALPDIPDHDAMGHKTIDVGPFKGIDPAVSVSALELFSGGIKDRVKDFIAYCRRGGFKIG